MCCGVGCNIEGTVWPLYCIVGGNILYFSEKRWSEDGFGDCCQSFGNYSRGSIPYLSDCILSDMALQWGAKRQIT